MHRGQIGVIRRETCPFRVTWDIANFFSQYENVLIQYSSPKFSFLDASWCLVINQNARTAYEDAVWITLSLLRNDQGLPKSMRYTLHIKKAGGAEEDVFGVKSVKFSYKQSCWGTGNFLCRSKLRSKKSQLAPSNALTIVCTLWEDETPPANGIRIFSRETQTEEDHTQLDTKGIRIVSRETQTEEDHAHLDTKDIRIFSRETQTEEDHAHLDTKGGDILRKHFQNLLIDGKDHDVTFKVKGQQFRAHKNILGARSPVFAAMFAHNMTESESGDVCIDDCEPNAFGEFLKYVYVGNVENMSPTIATGLYYASDKYDFPDLKETCSKFLKASSLTANVLCDVMTLAMRHGEDELLARAMEYFSQHVVETLMTVEWQRFLTTNPILANELTIKSLKTSSKYTE